MDLSSAISDLLSALFPRWAEKLKLGQRIPQLMVVGFFVLAFLAVIAKTLEDIMFDGEPFSGTILYALLHAPVLFTANFTATVAAMGYVGIFGLMLLESTSLPVPSEVILPFAGYLVLTGQLNLWLTITVSTVAGVIGCLIDYYIGMKGLNLLAKQKTLERLFNKSHMQTAENWFSKYGATAVFLSRLAPGFRTLVSFPAGAVKMPLAKFVIYTAAGCLVWDAVLVYSGVVVGSRWQQVASISNYLIAAATTVTLVVVIAFLIKRKKKKSLPTLKTTAN
jgi:membrane protein DedA with SNARE-associated domain